MWMCKKINQSLNITLELTERFTKSADCDFARIKMGDYQIHIHDKRHI